MKSTGHGAVGMKAARLLVPSQALCRGAGAPAVQDVSAAHAQQAHLEPPFLPPPHHGCLLPRQVLIVVPFREAALRVVQLFISLLEGDGKKKIIVSNKKRFNGEYGSDPEERPPNLKRPEDYEAVFVGNIDDHFRIGNFSSSKPRPRGVGDSELEAGAWNWASFRGHWFGLPTEPACIRGMLLARTESLSDADGVQRL